MAHSPAETFASLSALAGVGLAELSVNGQFLSVNEALCELLARSREDLLARGLDDVMHADDARRSRVALERVAVGGGAASLATQYVLPSGAILPTTSRLACVGARSDQPRAALAVIIAPPASDDRSSTTDEPLRWLIDNMRDYAIFSLNTRGIIETWGVGAAQIFGYADSEIIGRPFATLFTREDSAAGAPERELEAARARGQVPDERWHIRQSGERFWASGVLGAMHDSYGALRGFAKICRDATQEKRESERREAQLSHEVSARAAAEQATEAKDVILATVSHELRTPLSAMLLWAKMLTDGQGTERDRATGLAAIVRGGEAQRQLIEDLLDLSRMVGGTLRIEPTEVDLLEVVRAASDMIRAMPRAKNIVLTVDISQDKPVLVRGDAARLQQIVWNLLSNAVKFTPRGGRIEVSVQRLDGQARVVVRDSGQGIDPAFLPHVFDRFRQGAGDSTRPAAGLGLGLSIVRELVALHGGRVQAHSDGEGRGATFTVELPRLAGPASVAPPPSPEEGDGHCSARSLEGVRVLLVEDSLETQQALVWLLEASGAQVTAVTTSTAALAAMSVSWPHVLVSDIGLPGEDGYTLMRKVALQARSDGRPALPALALTAHARNEDRDRALSAGFSAYASKPIDPLPLLDAVTALAECAR